MKTIALPIEIEIIQYDKQYSVHVRVRPSALKDVTLLFCMLNDGCASEFCMCTSNFDSKIMFATSLAFTTLPTSDEKPVIALTSNDIGHICRFLLEWYRDGVAAVDHVDVAAQSSLSRREITLILSVTE